MKVRIYYSGEENLGRPEVVLGDFCNLMLTFDKYKDTGKPDKRFRQVLKARRRPHGRKCKDQSK